MLVTEPRHSHCLPHQLTFIIEMSCLLCTTDACTTDVCTADGCNLSLCREQEKSNLAFISDTIQLYTHQRAHNCQLPSLFNSVCTLLSTQHCVGPVLELVPCHPN